jgi:DNA-3-methyladenine glycosylase II
MKHHNVLNKDAKLKKLIQSIPKDDLHVLNPDADLREYLVYSIISQQLSTKVAKVIRERFLSLFGNKFPTNKAILKMQDDKLRAIGLSYQKLSYIKNIAQFFEEQKLHNKDWGQMDDDEIVKLLTQIKGVGQWTAEMVLMFALCREDVFSAGDYGIQVAMKKLYKINHEGKELQKKMHLIAEKWRPYRSHACMYLWAWKDDRTTSAKGGTKRDSALSEGTLPVRQAGAKAASQKELNKKNRTTFAKGGTKRDSALSEGTLLVRQAGAKVDKRKVRQKRNK